MKEIELYNGVRIPQIGFGTFQIEIDEVESTLLKAIEKGYRLFDTSSSYFNEAQIGNAIRKSGIPREEFFITTKVWVQDAGYEQTKKAFYRSLNLLGLDYIDLYMIHQPYGDYYGSWKAMEEMYEQGKIRAIGVSNFTADRFVDLYYNVQIPPMIDQVECHPFYQRQELREVLADYRCIVEAWGPFCEGQKDIFHHPALIEIARKHQCSVAQVILRWHIQNNVVVIPKTIHEEWMMENIDVWNFRLDEEDIEKIKQMDMDHSEIIDHQCYATAKMLNKYKIHD